MAHLFRFGRHLGGVVAAASSFAVVHQIQSHQRGEVLCEQMKRQLSGSGRSPTVERALSAKGEMEDSALFRAYRSKFGSSKKTQLHFKDVAGLLSEIGIKNDDLAARIFTVMDEDGSGTVDFNEMTQFCKMLAKGSLTERSTFLFHACNTSGDGSIHKYEMRSLVKNLCLACHESMPNYSMVRSEKDAELYAELDIDTLATVVANRVVYDMFNLADRDRSGTLELKEFMFWVARGGKAVNEFHQMFPIFEIFLHA